MLEPLPKLSPSVGRYFVFRPNCVFAERTSKTSEMRFACQYLIVRGGLAFPTCKALNGVRASILLSIGMMSLVAKDRSSDPRAIRGRRSPCIVGVGFGNIHLRIIILAALLAAFRESHGSQMLEAE
jgi:hypothetical protein